MKRSKKSKGLGMEIVVGVFVFAVLLGLAIFTIMIGGEALFRTTHTFEVVFENVMGLREGDDVVMRGMPIGKVSRLNMDDKGVHVAAALRHPVNLREDYTVEIVLSSVLGGRFMQIHEGSSDAPAAPPDMTVVGRCPRDLIAESTDLVTDFRTIAEKINRGEGTLGKLVHDDELYTDIHESVREIKVALQDRRLLEQLENSVANLNKITDKINSGEGTIGKLVHDDDLYEDVLRVIRDARVAMDDLRETAPILTFTSIMFGAF